MTPITVIRPTAESLLEFLGNLALHGTVLVRSIKRTPTTVIDPSTFLPSGEKSQAQWMMQYNVDAFNGNANL
jgi:hypothetical protein